MPRRKPKVGAKGARPGPKPKGAVEPRPVGRPAKGADDKRSESVQVRVTPATLALVDAASSAAGQSRSDWGLEAFELAIARGSTR